MYRGMRCKATFEDINDGQPTKGTINSKPMTDCNFQEHVRVIFDKAHKDQLGGVERLVPVEQVEVYEPFHIEYDAVPECLTLIAMYAGADGKTEEWSAGIAISGEITSIQDAEGKAVDSIEELESYGVDHFLLQTTHEVELDYLDFAYELLEDA